MQRVGHYRGDPQKPGDLFYISKADSNRMAYELAHTPFLGAFLTAVDNRRRLEDYMNLYGIGWDEIRYPTSLPGAGSGSDVLRSGATFVSKNLLGLYR